MELKTTKENTTQVIRTDDGYKIIIDNEKGLFIYDDNAGINRIQFTQFVKLPEWLASAMRYAILEKIAEEKIEPIPDYGDLMTIENFKELCESQMFTDYDGSGYYSDGKIMTRIPASPFEITNGKIDDRWSHVVWFNK